MQVLRELGIDLALSSGREHRVSSSLFYKARSGKYGVLCKNEWTLPTTQLKTKL
jgi:hypothetical protein